MKVIFVDGWKAFINENGINKEMMEILEAFPNKKIIVTNANAEEKEKFGMINMPYEIFSLEHKPNKTDGGYYETALKYYGLDANEVIGFENKIEAVKMAQKEGIKTFHYDKNGNNINELKKFLYDNL